MFLTLGTSNKQVLQLPTLIGPPLKHWRARSEVHSALGSWAWHRYCFSNEEFKTSSFTFSKREKSTLWRFYVQISFTLTFFFNNDLDLSHDKCCFFQTQRFVKQADKKWYDLLAQICYKFWPTLGFLALGVMVVELFFLLLRGVMKSEMSLSESESEGWKTSFLPTGEKSTFSSYDITLKENIRTFHHALKIWFSDQWFNFAC